MGAAELLQCYGWHQRTVSQHDLLAYIDRFSGARENTPLDYMGDIPLDDWFSPAEILMALTDSVLSWRHHGHLPQEVPRRDVMGPVNVPLICPEVSFLSQEDVVEIAAAVRRKVDQSGYLPGNTSLGGTRIGLGSYLWLVSDFYQRLVTGSDPVLIELPRVSVRYPSFAHDIDTLWRRMVMEDGTTDPLINMDRFCTYARLQSWTVRPAHRRQ